MYSEVVEHGV
jgi:hypothetical protein